MTRILFVTESLTKGGKERRLLELIKGIQLAFPDIICRLVILKNDIQYDEKDYPNIHIHKLERRSKKDLRIFFLIDRICKVYKPDIIHSWGSMPSIYCLPSVIMRRIVFINAMISNAICKRFSKNHIRAMVTFPFSDWILANSKSGLQAYHAPIKKSSYIHNGFDFKRIENLIDAEILKTKLGIQTRYTIGMVGAFHKRKDFRTFIFAARALLAHRADITFLAMGDGELYKQIVALVPEKLKSHIILTGNISQVESYINMLDIGVLTTDTSIHEEGISNAILEYMALAKPVIATRGGGTEELVVDHLTGFMIDPFNINMLVQKIEYLLQHEQIRHDMGKNGHNRIVDYFSLNNMVNQTINLYANLLKKKLVSG